MALEYADYPMANHGLKFVEQHRRMKSQRLVALGFGGAVNLIMLIPLLNFVAMPAAVAGATVLWQRELKAGSPPATAPG
jgi:CysZ protein